MHVGLSCLQCSCLPVKIDPSGGTDMTENLEKVVSLRGTAGRMGASPDVCAEGWVFIAVGSGAPLSVMAGGVLVDIAAGNACNE